METSRSADTIDLSKVFTDFTRVVLQNPGTIILTIVLCVAVGSLYFWIAPKTYESKMILHSDILSESYVLKMAENINTHVKDGDTEFLASILNMTNEEARLLREFKVTSALTPMSQQTKESDKFIVVISVRVKDNAILPKLQKGIVEYLTNNPYIKKRVDEIKKKCVGLIAVLDREIALMDTLKAKIAKGTFGTSKTNGISFMDISKLYEVSANMHEKKLDLTTRIALVESIQIIEDFSPYGKPVWPKLSITIFASLVTSVFILFLLFSYKTTGSTAG